MIMVCTAALSAPFLSFAPIFLDIAEPPPIPRPVARAVPMNNKGNTKPTAASASGPSPDTQIASTRLYKVWTVIAMIIGHESRMIAFFGSPNKAFTPSVWSNEGAEVSVVICGVLLFTGRG
jgi:hypothetical protein